MNSAQLTLTLEQSVIDKAERYAKTSERSLSDIVESYFKVITTNIPHDEAKLTPIVKSLKGSFRAPDDFDYKKELVNSLIDKYM